jgi:hypothetical protein
VAVWILFCAFCNCAGWLLSALHQLNARGYGVAFALLLVLAFYYRASLFPRVPPGRRKARLRRRFRRMFPLAFLILAAMAILGGVLWPPGNPDGLTQRIPRVLHWLSENRWHWVDHAFASMNTHACGFEWLMAPMFALLKTDRCVFLYNGICYLLMPGLVLSLFRRLGVSARAAWHWMWIIPAGLCFAMQAGSIGNDTVGALFAIAAVDFALRALASGRISDVWLSIVSAALLSGLKTSNLPLGLPWLVAILPSAKLLLRRPLGTAAVVLVALGSSLLPVMILIHQHGGGWLGKALEAGGRMPPTPWVTVSANCLNLTINNLQPPVFPLAGWWNDHIFRLLPKTMLAKMEAGFEPGAAHLETNDLQFEVSAGLGLGVSFLLLVSWICARCRPANSKSADAHNQPSGGSPLSNWTPFLVRWSAAAAFLVYLLNMNVSSPARLTTPYYCLLIPLLLTGAGQQRLSRAWWWKSLAAASFLLTAIMLVLNPPRPLWPAQTLLGHITARHPQSKLATRAKLLYESYAVRWDLLAGVRDQLPSDATNVGLMTFISASGMETSLWRPFGHRRVLPMEPDESREDLARRGINYAVVAVDDLHPQNRAWLEKWVQTHGGSILAQVPVRSRATGEAWPWFVIKLVPNRQPEL